MHSEVTTTHPTTTIRHAPPTTTIDPHHAPHPHADRMLIGACTLMVMPNSRLEVLRSDGAAHRELARHQTYAQKKTKKKTWACYSFSNSRSCAMGLSVCHRHTPHRPRPDHTDIPAPPHHPHQRGARSQYCSHCRAIVPNYSVWLGMPPGGALRSLIT